MAEQQIDVQSSHQFQPPRAHHAMQDELSNLALVQESIYAILTMDIKVAYQLSSLSVHFVLVVNHVSLLRSTVHLGFS
jgi:hypothetical protein